jgi:hypothetical protein
MLLNLLEILFAAINELLKGQMKGKPSRSLAAIIKRR